MNFQLNGRLVVLVIKNIYPYKKKLSFNYYLKSFKKNYYLKI